jgi:hypothetical protein
MVFLYIGEINLVAEVKFMLWSNKRRVINKGTISLNVNI